MKKLLIFVVPVALASAHASAAPSSGWGGIGGSDLAAGTGAGESAPLVLVQRGGGGRGGGGRAAGGVNRGGGGVNRGGGSVNRGNFNSGNFQRDVSGNRNVCCEPQRQRERQCQPQRRGQRRRWLLRGRAQLGRCRRRRRGWRWCGGVGDQCCHRILYLLSATAALSVLPIRLLIVGSPA